jgi:DNA replication licensing factor MCM6
MSRFDLMFVVQDIHDVNTDDLVTKHILALHRHTESRMQGAFDLSTLELQRFIRLARTFKPKLTPEAHERLVKCYKKLREDRSYVRGACGVTVRSLESLVRLAEAVARVHLDDKITVQYVQDAFDLQFNALRRVERVDIDLGGDLGGEDLAAAAEPVAPAGEEPAEGPAAQGLRRKTKVSFADYERISRMLVQYLAEQDQAGNEVKEEDLTNWYLEQVEDEIETEAQLVEKQHVVQLIISRLINKDRVVIVYRPSADPLRPEQRVLVKHPNFAIGEMISGSRH